MCVLFMVIGLLSFGAFVFSAALCFSNYAFFSQTPRYAHSSLHPFCIFFRVDLLDIFLGCLYNEKFFLLLLWQVVVLSRLVLVGY